MNMGCGCGPGETCDDMDNEMLSEADLARFGGDADFGIACHECGEELYEDAQMCTRCGAFQQEQVHGSLAAASTRNHWQGMSKVIIPVIVLLLAVTFIIIF